MFLRTSTTQPGSQVGLASVMLLATFYLYGSEGENSRYRWPVGVHGTVLHIHTNHRADPGDKLQTIIFLDLSSDPSSITPLLTETASS